jgi:hypothetical protein
VTVLSLMGVIVGWLIGRVEQRFLSWRS